MIAVLHKKDAGGPENRPRKAGDACRLIAAIMEIGLRFGRCTRMAAPPGGSNSTASSRAVRSRAAYAGRAAQTWVGPPPPNASDVRHIFQREDVGAEKRNASNQDTAERRQLDAKALYRDA